MSPGLAWLDVVSVRDLKGLRGVTMLDDQSFLVLNALHLKKMTSAEKLAEITDLPVDQVRQVVCPAPP